MVNKILKILQNYFDLLFINLKVKFFNLFEYLRVICNYYSNLSFLKIDVTLILSYLFKNPFQISKRFLLLKGERDIYTYGETPLTTLEEIAEKSQLSARDTVFELGCGRGRTCFWLHEFVGCSVVGIDYVPDFISHANSIKKRFAITGVEFRLEDLLHTDLQTATVIYLYGTCFPTPFIETLIEQFNLLPSGVKIITISYSLNEYVNQPLFEVVKRFAAKFTWGVADVYIQIKR